MPASAFLSTTLREFVAAVVGPLDLDWQDHVVRDTALLRPPDLSEGRANQRYALLFRDYLRKHPKCAAAYAELKRRLAQHHGDNSLVYSTIKDPACDIIMSAAEDWAERTSWQPGPTDF